MVGNHIKSWSSSSQLVIALNSGEAEFYYLVKTATPAKGLRSLMRDFELEVDTTIHADSTAALGMVHRKGVGKVRHIESNTCGYKTKCTGKDCPCTRSAHETILPTCSPRELA